MESGDGLGEGDLSLVAQGREKIYDGLTPLVLVVR